MSPPSPSLRAACPSTPPPLCADSCESAGTAGYPDLIRPSGFLGAVSRQSRRGPFVGPRSSASRSSTRLHALSRACDPFEAFVFHRYLRGFPSLPVHPVVSPRAYVLGSVWVACDSQPLSPLLMRLPVAAGPSSRFTKGSRRSHVGLSLAAHLQLHELPATRCGVLCFSSCTGFESSRCVKSGTRCAVSMECIIGKPI